VFKVDIVAMIRRMRFRDHSPPRADLQVTDEHSRLLADVADAGRDDYRLSVELTSGPVIVDLYTHYLAFAERGGTADYRASDMACRTYVKFGNCIQDRRVLHILIQPAPQQETPCKP
jgi:hypothetical protein